MIRQKYRDASSPLPVTIVIPVRNEAQNLGECIASVGAVADIVVVDSGSTDGTQDIARRAGAKVLQFEWNGRFPKKRNWALENFAFTTDWVLFMDADERLSPAAAGAIGTAIGHGDKIGFWLNYDNYFMGRRLRYGVPQRKLALFRIDAGRYERIEERDWSALDMEVHEHPVLEGPVGTIAAPLEHRDFRDLHAFIARHNDYSSWEARRCLALHADPVAWSGLSARQRLKYRSLQSLWFAPLYFLITYVLRGGFLDGRAGFIYAFLKLTYFFQVRAKIIESRQADIESRPPRNRESSSLR